MRRPTDRRLSIVSWLVLLGGCQEPLGPRGRDGGARTDASTERGDAGAERCDPGLDSDGDGLTDDVECMLGSDPFARDSDMDGVADGDEAAYPRICVATDPSAQRRPPPACTADEACEPGERCTGLDPTRADTDGDGVPDRMEDLGLDAAIDVAMGETDPRLADTDGDGTSDGMGGLEICRPEGLAMVTQAGVPDAPIQLGFAPSWGRAREVVGTMARGALLLDDGAAEVAALVAGVPSAGDVAAEAARFEGVVSAALGAGTSAVLIGRALTTHETQPAITSTYRVARPTSAGALRDALVLPLVGTAAPAGGPLVGAGDAFLVDVTTTRRTTGAAAGTTDVQVTVAPQSAYDDTGRTTSIAASDLANTTGVAEGARGLGHACQVFRGAPAPPVDFLMPTDVSPSMGPYQVRIGDTAARFFRDLGVAGVDFRVAPIAAQSRAFDFARPGLTWVEGTDPMGAASLAYRVTVERYMASAMDRFAPYPNPGAFTTQANEEPIAATILAHEQLSTAAATLPAEQRLREGARVVAFLIADETGTNDVDRYFARDTARWGRTYPEQLAAAIAYMRDQEILTFGLVNAVRSVPSCDPADPRDMRRCVIVGNGGAFLDITTATDADVAAAMSRVVAAVIGSASPYTLTRSPITSTLKVRVRGLDVPRSRQNGFDYDPATRAIVFFGPTYRPAEGDELVISYRVWEGSLG